MPGKCAWSGGIAKGQIEAMIGALFFSLGGVLERAKEAKRLVQGGYLVSIDWFRLAPSFGSVAFGMNLQSL